MVYRLRDYTLIGLMALGVACSSRQTNTSTGPATDDQTGRFIWQELLTDDVQAAQRFYGGLFGWQFEDTKRLGKSYVLVRSGGRYVAGITEVKREKPDEPVAQWLSYLFVADIDNAAKNFADAGGKVLVAPLSLTGNARAALVTDPAGAPVGLVSIDAELPARPADPPMGHFFWRDYLARDVEASLSFYRKFPGYRAQAEGEGDGRHYVFRHGPADKAVGGMIPIGDSPVRPNWLPYVRVADPAALARRTSELGGKVLLAPRSDVREGSLAIVADPNGGALALQKWPIS